MAITVASVELCSGIDYSVVRSKYTDPVVEKQIEIAIKKINRYINFIIDVNDNANFSDMIEETARDLMYNMMVFDGAMDRENPKKALRPILSDNIKEQLSIYKGNQTPIRNCVMGSESSFGLY